jgi:CubicO group peptidase (beta-lactamase class C family)
MTESQYPPRSGRAAVRQGPLVRSALVALAAVAASAAPLDAQRFTDGDFDGARAFIERAMSENDLPSVSVAVAKDGRIVWARGFGFADLERRIPATPRTMYSLASISKPITATALLRLVEQGRIDLDRPANDYLGAGQIHSRAWDASGATVRRVLSHSAGLPLHYEFFYDGEDHPPRTTDEGIARYGILIAPPGEVYQYSNLGYGIIERIAERVHGRAYADIMRTDVFEPLGMLRSAVSTGAGLDDSVAVRYGPDNRPVPYYDFDHRGGSAVYSSALDLARFGMFHLGALRDPGTDILADSTRRAMQRPISAGADSDGYGLGWGVQADDGGYRRISHTGGMPGVSTGLYLYPEAGVAIVVLSNRSNNQIGRIAQELAGVVLPGYAERVRERRASAAAQPRAPAPATAVASLLGEWSGMIYTPDDSVALHLLVQPDGDVHVRLGAELRTLLNDVSAPGGDRLVGRFAGMMPEENARRHGHSVLLDVRLRGDRLSGQASAQTTGWPYYFALTSYVELTRVSER